MKTKNLFYHLNIKFKNKVKLTVLKKTNTFQLKASLWYSLIFIDFRSSSSCLATWYKAKDQCLACLIRLTLDENIKRSAIQLVCAVLDTKKQTFDAALSENQGGVIYVIYVIRVNVWCGVVRCESDCYVRLVN